MAASLSSFTAALMAGSQENTVALAALNFDFSLYKVEAPREYQALGACLSNERRTMAEQGSQHVTARKLGALFKSMLPKVPNLIEAFGTRVSEIAGKATSKGWTTDDKIRDSNRNAFAAKMGVEGTTIWAAATSGTEALCVQLLACLLARFWAADEATSIWAEIIEARKAELSSRQGDYDFPEIVAMQASISREQLAEWDAGARAWLRTADSIHDTQQTQFRLIIENIYGPVNQRTSTYDSVLEAWVESMKVVEQLVAGVPQTVYDGAALVGLSAWHLFPNMAVYVGGQAKDIDQHDPLVKKGGLLTVGLEVVPGIDTGVRWSLPLAKLRYYGDPVVVTKTLDFGNARVSVEQLMMVALGCLSTTWPDIPDKLVKLCEYYECLGTKARAIKGYSASESWIKPLANASSKFLSASGDETRTLKKLVDFGARRGAEFFRQEKGARLSWQTQMLRMSTLERFVSTVKEPRKRVNYLRETLIRITTEKDAENWIIVYRSGKADRYYLTFATAITSHGKSHCTWKPDISNRHWDVGMDPGSTHGVQQERHLGLGDWTYPAYEETGSGLRFTRANKSRNKHEEDEFSLRYKMSQSVEGSETQDVVNFECFYGDLDYGALYRKQYSFSKLHIRDYDDGVSFDTILSALYNDELDLNLVDPGDVRLFKPLQALGMVAGLYEKLDRASISLDLVGSPLVSKKWCKALDCPTTWYSGLKPSHGALFSCIVSMETGSQDLDPEMLKEVMAVSIDDSIFALSTLMSDPYNEPCQATIVRRLGNIGKYGVSLIIPPPNMRMKSPNPGDWNIINHDAWDGSNCDSFGRTSLHLLLTDYRIPYTSSHRGNRDLQAFFQQAAVSIYDGSTWIGDIDIIKSLKSAPDLFIRVPRQCRHGAQEFSPFAASSRRGKQKAKKRAERESVLKEVVCIDSWAELLDKPRQAAVVHCQKNWLGRLATASLSQQLGYRVVVLPEDGCLQGCFSDVTFMKKYMVKRGDVFIC